jgi:hypothetical protein
MHGLFSLQIDIDALNPRSSLILYSRGSALSEFRVLKTYHIHFSSHLSFAARFHFPWLIFQIFLFGTRLGHTFVVRFPSSASFGALLALWLARIRAPFGRLLLHHHASAPLPSNPFIYRPFTIRVHVTHLPSTLPVVSIIRALLALSLAGIPTPFEVLLCAIKLLPAFPRISLLTNCSTSERHFCPPLYFLQKL